MRVGRGLMLAISSVIGPTGSFSTAQIGVFIGNEPARRAYLKAGFEVVGEKRDPDFEAAMGCPGAEVLLRDL